MTGKIPAALTPRERKTIVRSMQAWQLGETSEGAHLIRVTTAYTHESIMTPDYIIPMKQFIKEEQKHGNNLGRYLDIIGEKENQKNWGDTLFRKARYFNSSLEMWTITVLVVESTAQVWSRPGPERRYRLRIAEANLQNILIDEAAISVSRQSVCR